MGPLFSPFPWFGGKSRAADVVWRALGDVDNYVEPFAGSAAMLLTRPNEPRVETINDADGFVANFWRAIAADAEAVADAADWPCNETDLFARHSWLVRNHDSLLDRLHADPANYDAVMAGWWCWGQCNWIGSGWCSGDGPWVHNGETLVDGRKLPHLSAGRGINRQLPHLSAGQDRRQFIHDWFVRLQDRLREVRVACGDWSRVLTESVTVRRGTTGVFLDPPYTKGSMDYAAGGVGGDLAREVQTWCATAGHDARLRIVLCGHAGEHDALLSLGWDARKWTARKGYALTDEAIENASSETVWCSPHCLAEANVQHRLFY